MCDRYNELYSLRSIHHAVQFLGRYVMTSEIFIQHYAAESSEEFRKWMQALVRKVMTDALWVRMLLTYFEKKAG